MRLILTLFFEITLFLWQPAFAWAEISSDFLVEKIKSDEIIDPSQRADQTKREVEGFIVDLR